MSINWNLSKIKNCDDLCWLPAAEGEKDEDRKMNPVTNALIWTTMSVGIGEITEKTYIEFYVRSQMLSKLFGPPLHGVKNGKRYAVGFTLEDVRKHIGLSTNVFPMKKRAKFASECAGKFLSDEERRVQREIAEKAEGYAKDSRKPKLVKG